VLTKLVITKPIQQLIALPMSVMELVRKQVKQEQQQLMEQQAQLILAVKLEQLELKELVVTAVIQLVVVGSSFVVGVAS